jgi:hypothetical protein
MLSCDMGTLLFRVVTVSDYSVDLDWADLLSDMTISAALITVGTALVLGHALLGWDKE